ncbi:ribonuclease Z [Virgibacillus halotolerans]|uniref:ribonuclease Z n=1 Tax=Virgibacillus halotolerans TaxID=1071053 RepID=UPI00195FADE2|nr:ribonuclease Z [Virgibacillus halotolerans]MBM7598048.1 ribonuclease Z [Virgibacillus halotolerans]
MEITFLGTGAGVPSKERNVSAIALSLLQEQKCIWMFDCGESTQQQILRTTIKPGKINTIFITHMHGDHIFGLPGLLSSRSFQGGNDRLTVYGPSGIKEYIETSLKTSGSHLTYPLSIIEITEGKIMENGQFIVYATLLDHAVPSYGFRIVEKDKPGELLVDKLLEIGIKPGPIYQQIKDNEITQLPDGQKLYRREFIGPDKKGRIVSILGDTRARDEHQSFVEQSDLLIHEATFDHTKADLAKQYFHSTTTQAASLAKAADVKQLVLTHISSRYQQEDQIDLLRQARDVFPNTKLAYDFYHIQIDSK